MLNIRKWPIGTLVNVLAIIIGSTIGLLLQNIFTVEIEEIVFQAIGLATILIGIKMILAIPEGYMLIVIFSMIVGGIIGELADLQHLIHVFSQYLKTQMSISDDRFSEGLITSFLLFCIGSMTIVGAIEEGLNNDRKLLIVKSTLDGFTSIALASSMGIGVLFSVIPLLVFQGSITIMAKRLKNFFDENTLGVMTTVGGLLILGIAINLLQIGDIHLENLIPSLIVSILLSKGFQRWQMARHV